MSTSIIFDIETSPRPWKEIESFYKPPEPLSPFDPESVKYGNLKDEAKRAEKLAEAEAKYKVEIENEAIARDAHKCEWAGKAALSPIIGQILAIGFKSCKGIKIISGDESDIIKNFLEVYYRAARDNRRMIGHNIGTFDLPFIQRRAWILDIELKAPLRNSGRYWNDVFIDTMQVWGCGAREYFSLNDLSKALGGAGKPDDCTGATFAAMFLSGDPEQKKRAENYLRGDLDMTWAVAERMGLL